MSSAIIIAILELAGQVGAPLVKNMIEDLGKDEITLEDIEALRDRVKRPGEYLKEA